MLKKIYQELVAIRKELQAIRKDKELFSVKPREFAKLVQKANYDISQEHILRNKLT